MTIIWRQLLQWGVILIAWTSLATAVHAQQQALDSITAVVESACLAGARNRGYSDVAVTVRSLDGRLRLPLCDQPLSAFPVQTERVLGALSIGVSCAGAEPWTIYVRADVQAQRTIPVLVRPLASRSLISAQDLEMAAVSGSTMLNGVILDPAQIIGMELIRSLEAGSPVRVNQLRRPKVVKRGNLVTLLAGASGLEVRMQGKALGDAAVGDLLKVTNLSSGQLVEGKVNPDGTVTVY